MKFVYFDCEFTHVARKQFIREVCVRTDEDILFHVQVNAPSQRLSFEQVQQLQYILSSFVVVCCDETSDVIALRRDFALYNVQFPNVKWLNIQEMEILDQPIYTRVCRKSLKSLFSSVNIQLNIHPSQFHQAAVDTLVIQYVFKLFCTVRNLTPTEMFELVDDRRTRHRQYHQHKVLILQISRRTLKGELARNQDLINQWSALELCN